MRKFSEFTIHLKNMGFQPETVIDIGVAWGTEELYQPFANSHFILIEALPYFEGRLKELCARLSGEYFLKAVGEVSKKRTVFVQESPLSLAGINVLDSEGDSGKRYEIEVSRIDDILHKRKFPGAALLKLDVQGADLRALRGAPDTLAQMDVVIVEASLFNPQNLVSDIIYFMATSDFELYDVFGASYRPKDNALGQIDLVFAKQDSYLRKDKSWA